MNTAGATLSTPRKKRKKAETTYDKYLLAIVGALVLFGFLIFLSAATIDINKSIGAFWGAIKKQLLLGVVGGCVAGYLLSRINRETIKKYSFHIFGLGILLTALVFVPSLGLQKGIAKRWIDLGFVSFQPVEILKLGVVLATARLLAMLRETRDSTTRKKIYAYLFSLVCLVGAILVAQPDFGSIMVILAGVFIIYLVAGADMKKMFKFATAGIIVMLLSARLLGYGYVFERIGTFFSKDANPLAEDYQVTQGIIAIGSGKLFGKGYLKGEYKSGYVPEIKSDSIFAVVGEEFGFVGSLVLILLYLAFVTRAFFLAFKTGDTYASLVIIGISSMIFIQSLLNILISVGGFFLTGMPLIFVSQGGTALAIALAGIGVIMSMSSGRGYLRPAVSVRGQNPKRDRHRPRIHQNAKRR